MHFKTRRVSNGFPISQPQQTFPPPPQPSRPRNPALLRLHRFRAIFLPILLALVLATLILNAIYAYCVAKPFTDIADRLETNHTAETNGSLFGRRSDPNLVSRETAAIADSGTGPSNKSQPATALIFYALATPAASLVHLSFELIIHHNTPQHLRSRRAYRILLLTSSLLVAGWITTLSFWMHCELPSLNGSGQAVCPAQVRGHFMYGIHEVSIGKAAVGWAVALSYAAHVALLARGWKAQRRVWRMTRQSIEHGDVTEIVVRLGEVALKKETTT